VRVKVKMRVRVKVRVRVRVKVISFAQGFGPAGRSARFTRLHGAEGK
jgi:hypothetical protein